MSGCAFTEIKEKQEAEHVKYEPSWLPRVDYPEYQGERGRVTVAVIEEKNDFADIKKEDEHVVAVQSRNSWDFQPIVVSQSPKKEPTKTQKSLFDEAVQYAEADIFCNEDDMPEKPCGRTMVCIMSDGSIEPCDEDESLACYSGKVGIYCMRSEE